MRGRMSPEIRKVSRYWVSRFSKGRILDRADLLQESYLIYRECLKGHNRKKGKFTTYYAKSLKNHFLILFAREARDKNQLRQDGAFTCFGEFPLPDDDYGTLIEYIECQWWNAEEKLTWEQLLQHSREQLSGLPLAVFDVMVERPEDLYQFAPSNNITPTALGKYFGVSRNVIKGLDYTIRHAVLSAVEM